MDGLSAYTTVVATLETARKVIQYIQIVRDASRERHRLLLELVRARGLLSTLNDLAQDTKDEKWSHALQSLDGRDGPLHQFKSLLEEIINEGGLTGSVTMPQQPKKQSGQDAWTTCKVKVRRYLMHESKPKQSSGSSHNGGFPTRNIRNKKSSIVVRAGENLGWPFTQERVQQLLETLERIKTHFLISLSSDNIRLSRLIQSELAAVNARVEVIHSDTGAILEQVEGSKKWTDEQNLILRSIATLDFSTEITLEKMEMIKQNSQWFLQQDDFRRWHENGGSLLLTGRAGTGKTMIAKVVENYLKASIGDDEDFVIAVHFSSRNSPQSQSLQSVLAFIVQRMLEIRPRVQKYYNKLMLTGEGPLDIEDSLRIIHRARQDYRKFFIIFDGLDECDEQLLRDLIQRLMNLRGALRVFATSRPMPTIQTNLFSFQVELNQSDVEQRQFIRQTIKANKKLAQIMQSDPTMLEKVTETVIEKSQGVFIFATLMIESLSSMTNRKQVYQAVQDLPTNLHDIYKQMLVAVRHQQSLDAELGLHILQKLCTESQLNAKEILDMTKGEQFGIHDASQDIMNRCVRCCQGFVIARDETLQLVHPSARDFLRVSAITVPG